MWERFLKFATTDIWQMRLRHEKGSRPLLIRMLRIVVLAVKGFDEDKCMLRASALTFYTLLSIVPVVAMLFAVGKGFGVEDKIEASLLEQLPGQNVAVVQTDSTGAAGADFDPQLGARARGPCGAVQGWAVGSACAGALACKRFS